MTALSRRRDLRRRARELQSDRVAGRLPPEPVDVEPVEPTAPTHTPEIMAAPTMADRQLARHNTLLKRAGLLPDEHKPTAEPGELDDTIVADEQPDGGDAEFERDNTPISEPIADEPIADGSIADGSIADGSIADETGDAGETTGAVVIGEGVIGEADVAEAPAELRDTDEQSPT